MKTLSRTADDLLPPLGSSGEAKAPARKADGARDTRKTVLHVTPSIGGGGAEAMLMNLAASMDPIQWRTVIVVVDGRRWPEALARLRAGGAEVHDLASPAFLRPRTLWRLVKLIRRLRPDVVQTWMHHADFVGGWCARLAGVRRIVWGIHCREIHRNPTDSNQKIHLLRRALSVTSRLLPRRVVSCSAVALEDHARLGYPRAKMAWVPNGIDTQRFVPNAEARGMTRHDLRVPAHAPVVGFMGRFHEMKDLTTWLRAAALLQARRPEIHFLLCGGSEMELGDCARAALSVMPRRQQVHLTGFHAESERLYPAMDVFSLSSRTEACPMTLMEAMCCGVPCVATDVGDCARLLEGLGRVVPPHDPEALSRAWEEALATSTFEREELHRQAAARFDIAAAARGYEQVYAEVVQG